MVAGLKTAYRLVRGTVKNFFRDKCPQMGAALAYYTVFSLPPLLVLVVALCGTVFDPDQVRGKIADDISDVIGPEGASVVRSIIRQASLPGTLGPAALISVGVLLVTASTAGAQLRVALHMAWQIERAPSRLPVIHYLLKRVFALVLILGVACLLFLSLAVGAALQLFREKLSVWMPGNSLPDLVRLQLLVDLSMVTLLFAAVLRYLPDARVAWRHVAVGAVLTSLLFIAGKFGLGWYLGRSRALTAYGVAGSLAVVMIWIHYSSMVFLLGAEFTQEWLHYRGGTIEPLPGARKKGDRATDED